MTYRVRRPFATRWNDNDQYGHVNNTVFYEAMDTAVNAWMVEATGFDPHGEVRAYCAASGCEFRASVAFPESIEVGIRVARLGTTSVTWGFGILRPGEDEAVAVGRFVHVFVSMDTGRPTPIPANIRGAIQSELLEQGESG